jgi:hypothetical protein
MRMPVPNRTLVNQKWKEEANIKADLGKVSFDDRRWIKLA